MLGANSWLAVYIGEEASSSTVLKQHGRKAADIMVRPKASSPSRREVDAGLG